MLTTRPAYQATQLANCTITMTTTISSTSLLNSEGLTVNVSGLLAGSIMTKDDLLHNKLNIS